MSAGLAPFRCLPLYLEKPWGSGVRLRGVVGLPAPPRTGEAWLVSDVDGSPTPILDGPWAGRTLRELVAAEPVAVLGPEAAGAGEGARFPLLVKLLEVAGRLSVQVHPDGPTARALGQGQRGKCEAWFVLDAGPAGEVGLGFEEPVAPAALPELARAGTLGERLRRHRPGAGEAIEILPGTFHYARDLLFLEVQETCDLTYRVWDWGSDRALHLAEAAECLRRIPARAPGPPATLTGQGQLEVAPRSPFRFTVHGLVEGARLEVPGPPGPRVVVALSPGLSVWAGGAGLELSSGQAAVLPACCDRAEVRSAGDPAQVAVAGVAPGA